MDLLAAYSIIYKLQANVKMIRCINHKDMNVPGLKYVNCMYSINESNYVFLQSNIQYVTFITYRTLLLTCLYKQRDYNTGSDMKIQFLTNIMRRSSFDVNARRSISIMI